MFRVQNIQVHGQRNGGSGFRVLGVQAQGPEYWGFKIQSNRVKGSE